MEAWDWTANLGAPAALVAAAVLATLSETREDMIPCKQDPTWVCRLKKGNRFLLLSSFALEITSIFVGMVMGTCLLGHGEQVVKAAKVGYNSPLALLHHHHEFEYLVIQLGFLLGLLNWLAAVVLELLIPQKNETKCATNMNKCLASWLVTLMLWITAFYNNHLNFYSSLFLMLCRFCALFPKKYLLCWPPRLMSALYLPSFIMSGVLTWRAFRSSPEDKDWLWKWKLAIFKRLQLCFRCLFTERSRMLTVFRMVQIQKIRREILRSFICT